MDAYSWAKALHLVSVVSWFAGLFYLGRLFIYHAEALRKSGPEGTVLSAQYALMEKRLWRAITTPAMIGTVVFGVWLAVQIKAWTMPWFQVKLAMVVLLLAYHGFCGRLRRGLERGKIPPVKFLRLWNESATVLLFAIVFTAVFKRPGGALYGLIAVAALTALGMSVFLFARRKR